MSAIKQSITGTGNIVLGANTLTVAGTSSVSGTNTGDQTSVTGNAGTATALATARNVFNISFDGTANVDGDAVNTGHFASIPSTGAAGHFVTKNGTAPTLIAGRSAWYSDGSGVPSFKNGTGTAVTLVRSSDIGVSVQAYDADLTTWAGITPGAGVGTGILSRPVFATTATAAGTTTLTVASASTQEFTGSTTQTVTMPVVTTLVAGWATTFINKSTGNVTLNSSGGNAIVVLAGGQSVTLVCNSISADTTAAAWDILGRENTVPEYLVRITADQTVTNSTTLVDATNLSLTVPAGTYELDYFQCSYGDVAAGGKYNINYSAAVDCSYRLSLETNNAATATSFRIYRQNTGATNDSFNSGLIPGGTTFYGRASGIIIAASSTTVKIQFANLVAAGNTVLQSGTYLRLRRIIK